MTNEKQASFPSVRLVTMRGGATVQNATYLLLNVLDELTDVSLVTVRLADDSRIHGSYDVTEIAGGARADGLLGTALLFLLNQLRICRAVWRSDEEVIYFFGGTAYVLPVAVARLLGRTVVVQPRGDVPLTLELEWRERYPDPMARGLAGLLRLLEAATMRLAHRIVTYTPAMAEQLGLERHRDKLYPHGTRYIETEDFRPTRPFAERGRRFGMVGRLDVEKGVDEVAAAVDHLDDDTEVIFVGDGDRRDQIESTLADAIAEGRVDITGWVDHEEIPRYLNEMRLLVLASAPTEGLPTAIQEAFACGTPVLATPVAAIPDVVVEGETGFLLEDTDPGSIAERVDAILDRDDLAEISDNCRSFAVDHYSFDASVDRFRTLLDDIATPDTDGSPDR